MSASSTSHASVKVQKDAVIINDQFSKSKTFQNHLESGNICFYVHFKLNTLAKQGYKVKSSQKHFKIRNSIINLDIKSHSKTS